MRPLFRCFAMFIRQITKDSMLYAVLAAPLLTAGVFRFGLPYVESLLCAYFHQTAILAGYYLLVDLFLALITPYMFCFAASMVMLTEMDENIAGYMAVTPVSKRGYIISRLIFPALLSFVVSCVLVYFSSLTKWNILLLMLVCLLTSLLSIVISLLIVSFSHNRVEGMAMAKLSGIIMLGLPVPFFLHSGVQYLFFALPSFWVAKLSLDGSLFLAVPALIASLLWLAVLYGRFEKKIF